MTFLASLPRRQESQELWSRVSAPSDAAGESSSGDHFRGRRSRPGDRPVYRVEPGSGKDRPQAAPLSVQQCPSRSPPVRLAADDGGRRFFQLPFRGHRRSRTDPASPPRAHGPPLDSKKSVRKLERALDRVLRPQKRRPPTEEREKLVWCPWNTWNTPWKSIGHLFYSEDESALMGTDGMSPPTGSRGHISPATGGGLNKSIEPCIANERRASNGSPVLQQQK